MQHIRMLKIKLKSLAAESKIIREEERKTNGSLRSELHSHRIMVVRSETRATHLAYGYLRGREYTRIEQYAKVGPNWDRVAAMVKKYGGEKPQRIIFNKSGEKVVQELTPFETWATTAKDTITSNAA